jgi:PAS domain S-box-containing protein
MRLAIKGTGTEDLFEILANESPIGLCIEKDGGLCYTNPAFQGITGYGEDELLGKDLIELIVPEDKGMARENTAKVLKGERILPCQFRLIHKNGSIRWVMESVVTVQCGGGWATLENFIDITERKQEEEALRNSEEKSRQIFESATEEWTSTFDSINDAISITGKDFRLLRVNKAFADMYHVEPDQVIGKRCYEVTGEGKEPIEGCPHQETLRTEKPAKFEFLIRERGIYVEISTSPIFNKKREVVGSVHIARDITEQKQQNERLMSTDRLASLGELAAGTAHEFNNPLTSVIGLSQLLMDREIPEDIREDLKVINSEAQRAANVARNLLAFGAKHASAKKLDQLNSIIEDVLGLRAYEHKVKNIDVEKHLAPDLPKVMADYFQMQQVFMNIIINAEYFMIEAHSGGTLTITTKKYNDAVRISIADDGPGIPEENLGRIFDPFFTTKEAGKGTGLGLSICHSIVTEHGGQMYVNSQLGKGTSILVDLPINGHDHNWGRREPG